MGLFNLMMFCLCAMALHCDIVLVVAVFFLSECTKPRLASSPKKLSGLRHVVVCVKALTTGLCFLLI